MIYRDHAAKYFEKGLVVFPIQGKVPKIKEWQNITLEQSESYVDDPVKSTWGISLLCGARSGIIAFDIDTDEIEILEIINKYIPRSPSAKRGLKGETRFFRYSTIKTAHIKGIFDVLSDGAQTVLPPSIHPTTEKPYTWLGGALCDIDIENLPLLSPENILQLEAALNAHKSYVAKTTGRNNKLTAMVWAKLQQGVALAQIAREIVEQDASMHEVPYFTDQSGEHKALGSVEDRVKQLMVHSVAKFEKEVGKTYLEFQFDLAEITTEELAYYEPETIDLAPPSLGFMIDSLTTYFQPPTGIQRQTAQIAALHLMGAVIGNRCYISWFEKKTFCNFYAMLLLPSARNKGNYFEKTQSILTELGLKDRIPGSAINSTAALYNILENEGVQQVLLLDEFHGMLSEMSDPRSSSVKLAGALSTLYTKGGQEVLSERIKGIKKVYIINPSISILAATQPSSMDMYLEPFFKQGLLGRFIFGFDHNVVDIHKPVVQLDIVTHLSNIYNRIKPQDVYSNPFKVYFGEGAEDRLNEINDYFAKYSESISGSGRKVIAGRAAYLTGKIALVIALGRLWDGVSQRKITVDLDEVETAFNWTKWHVDICKPLDGPMLPNARGVILDEIRKHGSNGVGYLELYKVPRIRVIKDRDFDAAIKSLVGRKLIVADNADHYKAMYRALRE